MKCMRLFPCIALLLLVASVEKTNAQIREPLTSRISTAGAVDTSAAALLKRIEALESTIAQLQQKLAFIKSVSPLVIDAGGDLTIRGNQVAVESQLNLNIRSGGAASITATSQFFIRSHASLDLAGLPLRLNAGNSPVACAPQSMGGQVVVTCDPNVLIAPPLR